MYKLILNSKMPRFIKWLLLILLTVTVVYWLLVGIYKLLDLIRAVIHWLSDKKHWWEFLMCIFVLALGSLILAQFVFGLDPWGKVVSWFYSWFNIITF